jgi:hypothetical protein
MTAPTAAKALVAPPAGLTYGVADPAVLGAVPATSMSPLSRRTIRDPRATATMTRRSWPWYEPPLCRGRAERARLTPDDCGVCGATDHRRRDRFLHQVHGFDTSARQTVPTIDAITPWRRRAPAKVRALLRSIPIALRDQRPPRRPPPCGEAPGAAGSGPSLTVAAPRRLVGVYDHAPGQGEPRARESCRQPIRSNT